MGTPTRTDIERAAARYFATLRDEIDQPRDWPDEHYHCEIAFNVEMMRKRIAELEDQLRDNRFDRDVEAKARQMLEPLSVSMDALSSQLAILAQQLAAKATRQQIVHFEHVLRTPAAGIGVRPIFAISRRTRRRPPRSHHAAGAAPSGGCFTTGIP
jgi:hypothetical protein